MTEHDAAPGGPRTARPEGTLRRLAGALARQARAAVRPEALPRRLRDLTAADLTRVVGREITRMEVLGSTSGTTDRITVAIEGDPALPERLFVKAPPGPTVTRLFGSLAQLGENEVRFYGGIAAEVPFGVPVVHGVAHEPRTGRYLLVLEDLAARGVAFADVLSGMPLPHVRAALDTLASLHATFWDDPRLGRSGPGDLGWLRGVSTDPNLGAVAAALGGMRRRLERRDPSLTPRSATPLLTGWKHVTRLLDQGPHTVLHGDSHPGNMYVEGDRVGLFDWQVIRRGNPLRDVTYLLVLALPTEERERHERELLDHYRDALAAAGGPAIGADAAWEAHRRMASYPYVSATFTAAMAGLQNEGIALESLRRSVAAIDSLGTVAALGLRV